jgi:hypothetical protein
MMHGKEGAWQMSDRLVQRCMLEFERYVEQLHSNLLATPGGVAKANIPICPYLVDYTKSSIPDLVDIARAAYQARAAFAQEGPAWAQPLPIGDEVYPIYKAEGAMHILGCYALSLEAMDHDYLKHPRFYDFACGMMAHLSAPDHVRYDIDLQAEFPAKELPGLCGRMMWSGKGLRPTERLRAIGDKRLLI